MNKYSEKKTFRTRPKKHFSSTKKSLINLIIGIWVVNILITIVAVIIVYPVGKSSLSFVFGELLGSLIATGFAYHMYYTIDTALDMGAHAEAYIRKASFLRSAIMLVIMAFSCFFPKIFYPVATFLGLYNMKLSIFIQPILSKIQHRRIG